MSRRTENLLLEDAGKLGFEGIRVDIRGGGGFTSGHDGGDLFIGKPVATPVAHDGPDTRYEEVIASELYVIEEKYKSTDANKYLQEDGEKLDAMIEFAEAIGATPVFAGRWSSNLEWSPGPTHFLKDAREVERTSAGNVSLKPETAEKEYQKTNEFFSEAKVTPDWSD